MQDTDAVVCLSHRFGAERGHKAGPDTATTVIGEPVRLKLHAGGIKVSSMTVAVVLSPLLKSTLLLLPENGTRRRFERKHS